MKILLSEKWRYEMKALFCIEAIGIIFCTISFVKDVEELRIFPWEKKPLLVSYNVKKQIVMPYNEVTKSILETDKWYSLVQYP